MGSPDTVDDLHMTATVHSEAKGTLPRKTEFDPSSTWFREYHGVSLFGRLVTASR